MQFCLDNRGLFRDQCDVRCPTVPLTARSSSLQSTFRLPVIKGISLKDGEQRWLVGTERAKKSNELSGNEHHPLSQNWSSRVGLATLRGRVRMVLYFHLLLFCLKVKASPKTGLSLDYIQSAFSCSEQGGALVCCIMDNTPGDKRGLLP